jgi:HlyD family secretion protein
MRNRLPFIAIAAVVVIFVVALVVSQRSGRRAQNELSGTIEAYEVQVTARVSGRVLDVRCEEGRVVKAGDTLLLIDTADYRNAALASQAQFEAAQANVVAAESRARLADSSLNRLERLFRAGNLTRQEFDKTQSDARAANEALAAARTSVSAAAAQLDIAAKRRSDCVITAPASGAITTVAIHMGENAAPGSTLLTIIDMDQTWLTVYLPERLIGRVRLGDTARIRVDGYPGRDFPGTIGFIADKAEFTPKDIQTREERINQVYRVKVALPNAERILKPGMPADAFFTLR